MPMRSPSYLTMSFVFLLSITGCGGGGGGGGTLPEPTPLPQPTPQPQPQAGRGALAVAGLERIPLSAIKLTNQEVAKRVTIAESNEMSHSHPQAVMDIFCHSYITGCDDPEDLSTTPYSFFAIGRDNETKERRLRQFLNDPAFSQVKLVSYSAYPISHGIVDGAGEGAGYDIATLPFVVLQSTGNDGTENFYNVTNYSINNGPSVAARKNIELAIAADKVLYVAGYTRVNGRYERHETSTGCTGVDSSCLYAPFVFHPPGSASVAGTSASAPNVAAALASVLAIFPDTEGVELIRLAKACAVAEPGLSGLGRADFGCMTEMDAQGQWRLVQGGVRSLIAPNALNQLAFPGTTSVSAQFQVPQSSTPTVAGQPNTVTLGVTHQGSFGKYYFQSGVPFTALGSEGWFPILYGQGNHYAVGGGYTYENLFIASTYGQRQHFFGLDQRHGYRDVEALDTSVGHRNLFARFSQRWSGGTGPLRSAQGTAYGFTAQTPFLGNDTVQAQVAVHTDRFAGGVADTVFGKVQMAQGGWNHRAQLRMTYIPTNTTTLSMTMGGTWLGHGRDDHTAQALATVVF